MKAWTEDEIKYHRINWEFTAVVNLNMTQHYLLSALDRTEKHHQSAKKSAQLQKFLSEEHFSVSCRFVHKLSALLVSPPHLLVCRIIELTSSSVPLLLITPHRFLILPVQLFSACVWISPLRSVMSANSWSSSFACMTGWVSVRRVVAVMKGREGIAPRTHRTFEAEFFVVIAALVFVAKDVISLVDFYDHRMLWRIVLVDVRVVLKHKKTTKFLKKGLKSTKTSIHLLLCISWYTQLWWNL